MGKAEVLGPGRTVASVDGFQVTNTVTLQEIVALLVPAKAKEQTRNKLSGGLAVLAVVLVLASNFQAIVESQTDARSASESQNCSSIDIAVVKICPQCDGIRREVILGNLAGSLLNPV